MAKEEPFISKRAPILSPTLWILVMGELLTISHREGFEVIGYADVICRGIFSSTYCQKTQLALKLTDKWCKIVGLSINPKNSEISDFTNERKPLNYKASTLFGAEIPLKKSVKFLGITFTKGTRFV